jgi:hypothetical protein
MDVKYVQGAIILVIIAVLILCAAIRPIREWLFGPPEIDDSKGFPWSRHKHRTERTNTECEKTVRKVKK